MQILDPAILRFNEAKEPILRIEAHASRSVLLRIRGFTRHGLFYRDVTTTPDRVISRDEFRLPGIPLALRIHTPTLDVRPGEVFVRADLRMGGYPCYFLCQGYVTGLAGLTWPPGIHRHELEGPGNTRVITGTDPAAGNEISETVPTNAVWKLLAIRFKLVTDATVATRRVSLKIDDGANVFYWYSFSTTQSESETKNYSLRAGSFAENNNIATEVIAPLGGTLLLLEGFRIRTSTTNLQAGDNYGAPVLYVEEWIKG